MQMAPARLTLRSWGHKRHVYLRGFKSKQRPRFVQMMRKS